jgi:hypothetical protein
VKHSQHPRNIINTATYFSIGVVWLALFLISCSNNKEATLFEELPSSQTNIHFNNTLTFDPDFNIYRYRNFYNGGGIALGDINNDGLLDLFFTANMEENMLYLNKGNTEFQDISEKAGIGGSRVWSTGVSMADVNGDGLTDIYVTNSGIVEGDDRKNELYINNGDSTFTESAEAYGIANSGLSIHGTFFDYDKDGDLDLYLINNSYRAIGSFDLQKADRSLINDEGGDKLYRNDGGQFTDVTKESGIFSSEIGFALGASVADVNRDGWQDIYVSNDFFERDYLYINNQDGTFNETLKSQIRSTSLSSMGADIADLNADGYPEIFVTDMLPEPESRLKLNATFDTWERYRKHVTNGYYHQFTRNTLQLNNKNGTFSEVGRWAGIEATDWSWGANIADFDLDGRKDIFVANGIYQDLTNLDYLDSISQGDMVKRIVTGQEVNFEKLIDMIPSNPISNYAFSNTGHMRFADSSASWGLDKPGFSSGSAYGDLDNDGDLDLVINNLEQKASVYENQATRLRPNNRWLQVELKGTGENSSAFGTQLTAWADGKRWYVEQMPIRGFQSSVDPRPHLGLGRHKTIDSLIVDWPSDKQTRLQQVETNQVLRLNEKDAQPRNDIWKGEKASQSKENMLFDITSIVDIEWTHRENKYSDFDRDQLLFHMRSTEGPALCKGDVNGDGLEDLYLGGAKNQPGSLLIQNPQTGFEQKPTNLFKGDAISEDVDCAFLDANGDGKMDLYVASGSNEFSSSSSALIDRLYFNTGDGNFERSQQPLPGLTYETTSTIAPADFDADGDMDLFVGVRLRPFAIGTKVRGYLLENDGTGTFKDVTQTKAPALLDTGMITDAEWGDFNGDSHLDLIVAGEWMPLRLFSFQDEILKENSIAAGLDSTDGWWHSVSLADLDMDGDLDFIAGNHGLNSRFEASKEQPAQLWANDFDGNGTIEQILTTYKNGEAYPMALKHNLIKQIPSLESKYPDYKSFAGQSIGEIFSAEKLKASTKSTVYQLASVVGWNDGAGNFSIEELPMKAQFAPIYDILAGDLNHDGATELLLGGNLHNVKPEVGRYDASYGVTLSVKGDSLMSLSPAKSGFKIDGEIRSLIRLGRGSESSSLIIVGRNDAELKVLEMAGHE